jgi:RES domain-containing protein
MDIAPDGFLPSSYQLLRISTGVGTKIKALDPPPGLDWKAQELVTRSIGDDWLASLETALARVPSAIAPYTWNYLLNPEHSDAQQVQIAEVIGERFDNRLFRFGTR